MYNPQPENVNIGSTASITRSILDSQLQRQSEYMINRSNSTSNNIGVSGNTLDDFNNTYTDARKQIQMLNNAPISNDLSIIIGNAESKRIQQITASDTMLNQFKNELHVANE